MSNKEFWEEEPNLLWTYRNSYMEKLKAERDKINHTAWLNGLYVYEAVSKSIYNNFKKETLPVQEYTNKPYDFDKTEEELRKEKQLEVEEKIKERNRQIKEMLKKK